jgi:APA family basic amino acid/polyamine antiporter
MKKDAEQTRLKPSLSLFDAVAISVGAIVGAGIFVVTGIAAGQAGSALVVSMLIAAFIALFSALSIAELAARFPEEGSVYEFGRALISPFAGFLSGWMWILSNVFAGSAVSLGFAYYFTYLLPGIPPPWVAAVMCIGFSALNYYGVRQSVFLNNLLVTAKLLILAFFCIFGALYTKSSNLVPFSPFQPGMLFGVFYIFFAYGGFARVAVVAEEVKDARRNVPRAVILSLVISTIFYIAVGTVALGLTGAANLSSSKSPLADAMGKTGSPFAVQLISLGGLLATASVLLTSIMGVSRMAYAMARGNDLPLALSKVHEKHNTPYYSVWFSGIMMALLVLFIDLSSVVAISTFAMLFYYASSNISALRLKENDRKYPQVVPAVGAITCVALLIVILFLSPLAWVVGLAGLIAGAVYYSAKRSLRKNQSLT